MSKLNTRATEWIVFGGIGAVMIFVLVAFLSDQSKPEPQQALQEERLPVYWQLSPFELTNQSGKIVSLDSLKGNVWLCDVIFTRCPGPCTQMTQQMKAIQDKLPKDEPIKLISFTTDPVFDTPKVLERYGKKFEADTSQWSFLTGEKPQVHHAITNSLRQVMMEKDEADRQSPTDFFIHSTVFVLIDQEGNIRKTYEGLKPETHAQILADIDYLLSTQ